MDKPSDNQTGTEHKYNLRRAIKAPIKLDLEGWPRHKVIQKCKKWKKIERKVTVAFSFPCRHHDVDTDQDIIDHVQAQFDSMSSEQIL